MIKTRIKKNDSVVVITGADRGRRGKVLNVDRNRDRLIVEGINKKKKFIRPSQESPRGGVISLEYPINISNIMYFCDKCKKGIRIGIKIVDNRKVRICRKCGMSIDK